MPIYMFSGLPGSGKSYHMVSDVVIKALISGRKIFTNLPLNIEAIECFTDVGILGTHDLVTVIDSDFIQKLPDHREELLGSVLIIDEVQNYFLSSKALTDEALVEFFTKHRHYGMDIILGTQDVLNINKVIRNLIEVDWHFSGHKMKGNLFKHKYTINMYLRGSKKSYQKSNHQYDPKVFALYQSFDRDALAKGKVEQPVVKADNKIIKYSVGLGVGAVLFFMFVFSVGSGFLGRDKVSTANASEVVPLDVVSSKNNISVDVSGNDNSLPQAHIKDKKQFNDNDDPSPGHMMMSQSGEIVYLKGRYLASLVMRVGTDRIVHFKKNGSDTAIKLFFHRGEDYRPGQYYLFN